MAQVCQHVFDGGELAQQHHRIDVIARSGAFKELTLKNVLQLVSVKSTSWLTYFRILLEKKILVIMVHLRNLL